MELTKEQRIAFAMLNQKSPERREAEKMMGCAFDNMTPEQRLLSVFILSAMPSGSGTVSRRKEANHAD